MYFTYLLTCADGTLYCGTTNDLEKRIATHNAKKGAKYTKTRTPVSLFYYETFDSKSEALKREIQIKRLSHAQKSALKN